MLPAVLLFAVSGWRQYGAPITLAALGTGLATPLILGAITRWKVKNTNDQDARDRPPD
jgi:hypothetical protein